MRSSSSIIRVRVESRILQSNKLMCQGQARLVKFYGTHVSEDRQQAMIKRVFGLISNRPPGACNFLDDEELSLAGANSRIVYRHCKGTIPF